VTDFNITETAIPEGKYLYQRMLHCKDGYRTNTNDDNTVMVWTTACDADGNWTPVLGCEKKGIVVLTCII